MNEIFKTNLLNTFILSNFALLLFILNIPGTIALRNLLALMLLVTLFYNQIKSQISIKPIFRNKNIFNLLLILLVLTIYIFFHTIFFADEFLYSLDEYRAQWVYPMLYFFMGVIIAFFATTNEYFKKESLINVLFFSLFVHILYVDFVALFFYFGLIEIDGIFKVNEYSSVKGRFLTRYGGLTGSPVLANYITSILNAILIVEFIHRLKGKKRILKLNSALLFVVFLLCILSSAIEGMRFGVISLFFMGLTGAFFYSVQNNKLKHKHKYLVIFSFLIICIIPAITNAKLDKRWSSLFETIPIAIDTENNSYWHGDLTNIPVLSNGQKVDHSNYMRIAWMSQGTKYILKDFYGLGYGRNVFGHAIEKYEENVFEVRGYHSHSSIIDLTIGIGLAGLIIWLFFVIRVIFLSARIFITTGNYFALLTVLFMSSFFIRSMVDSNMRDHMFKQFLLLMGISVLFTFYESKKNAQTE